MVLYKVEGNEMNELKEKESGVVGMLEMDLQLIDIEEGWVLLTIARVYLANVM